MSNMQFLVQIGHGESTRPALSLALFLASRLGAYLDGVQVVSLPPAAFTVPEAVPMHMDTVQQQYASAQARDEWFAHHLELRGVSGTWHAAQGDTAGVLCEMAAAYDLLVLMRDNDRRDAPLGYGTASRCVFGSGTPVLMVPADTPVSTCGERVCVAWNGSRESSLALRGALPVLRSARKVRVLDGSNTTERDPVPGPPVPDLRTWLERHGLDVEYQTFRPDGPAGPAIEAHATEFSADLIVMGAWGRSRISELMLGGATRHLFGNGHLPMLVAH